jgi:hypothetical protein
MNAIVSHSERIQSICRGRERKKTASFRSDGLVVQLLESETVVRAFLTQPGSIPANRDFRFVSIPRALSR